MKRVFLCILLLIPVCTLAQVPLQGPQWSNSHQIITVHGEVLAIGAPYQNTPCIQLKVQTNDTFTGGRLWVCGSNAAKYSLQTQLRVTGIATDTRLTKMGSKRRVIPIVFNP